MKTLFLVLIFSACAFAAHSPATARLYKNHFACGREAWLRDSFEFAQKRDKTSLVSYLAMGRCFRTLDAKVYILTLKGDDAAQILSRGRKVWVHSDAVKLD